MKDHDTIQLDRLPPWFADACTKVGIHIPADCQSHKRLCQWFAVHCSLTRPWWRRVGRRGDALVVEGIRPNNVSEVRQFADRLGVAVAVADGQATFTNKDKG